MTDPAAACWRMLCRLDDVPDPGARGFGPPPGGFTGLFVVRRGSTVVAYVNACPHLGVPLDWLPDRFLSADENRIVCATHGATFRIEDGVCISGPCYGGRLESVMIQIKDAMLSVPQNAGL